MTELKRSTRALFRSIGRNLELVPGLIAEAKEVPDATDGGLGLLIAQMRKLRGLLFEKLLTTVDEERKRQDYLSGLISREEESNAEITKLENEVATLSADRDAEVEKRETVINRVIKDLEAFAMHGEVVARRVRKESEKRAFCHSLTPPPRPLSFLVRTCTSASEPLLPKAGLVRILLRDPMFCSLK